MKHLLLLSVLLLTSCQLGSGDCNDGRINGLETDLDCGGTACQPCAVDAVCLVDADCASAQCELNRCVGPVEEVDAGAMPSCDDGLRNGTETDVDCGGECTQCPPGSQCVDANDCEVGRCLDGVCTTDLPSGCGAPLLTCNQQCIDPTFDRFNCGGCGVMCTTDQQCAGGMCTNLCLGGTAPCGSACFDFMNDPQHCGSCTNTCSAGEMCLGGECILPCAPNQTACNGRCVALDRDAENCGQCGFACAPGSGCIGGECVTGCTSPLTLCNAGTLCVDTRNDPSHCGGCNQNCPAPLATSRLCSNSMCVPGECFPGYVDCNMDPQDGCEAMPMGNDHLNCGQCGRQCGGNELCNSGLCCNAMLPPGTYQATCSNCLACEGVLSCTCPDQTQALQQTSIQLFPSCGMGYFNCNGVLQCGPC